MIIIVCVLTVRRFPNALPHPVIFEVKNTKFDKVSHCGVLEFSAPRKAAFMPQWVR
jgi:hypothetical protein